MNPLYFHNKAASTSVLYSPLTARANKRLLSSPVPSSRQSKSSSAESTTGLLFRGRNGRSIPRRWMTLLCVVGFLAWLLAGAHHKGQRSKNDFLARLETFTSSYSRWRTPLPRKKPAGSGATDANNCDICSATPEDTLCLKYGSENIARSRAYTGTGARFQKVLRKAQAGESISIGVIGGSISAGHGLWPGELTWHSVFVDWLRKEYPQTNITLLDGALPAMNAAYFSYCFPEHLPRDLDMYLIELDVNNDFAWWTLEQTDDLYRALLNQPQEPAIVHLSVFALSFPTLTRGEMYSSILSQYYDVPTISIKNFLLPQMMRNESKVAEYFAKDYEQPDGTFQAIHINHKGHAALGESLILYTREQQCRLRRQTTSTSASSRIDPIPRLRFTDMWSADGKAPVFNPTCKTTKSAHYPLKPISKTQGWELVDWHGKSAWATHTPGSIITFDFVGTQIGMFYWNTQGTNDEVKPGKVECWVDDAMDQISTVNAFGTAAAGTMFSGILHQNLENATHTLSCNSSSATDTGGHEFRLQSIAYA